MSFSLGHPQILFITTQIINSMMNYSYFSNHLCYLYKNKSIPVHFIHLRTFILFVLYNNHSLYVVKTQKKTNKIKYILSKLKIKTCKPFYQKPVILNLFNGEL